MLILGDILNNSLQQKGYNARIRTEKIMYKIAPLLGKGEQGDFILTIDKQIPINSDEDLSIFLKDSGINLL